MMRCLSYYYSACLLDLMCMESGPFEELGTPSLTDIVVEGCEYV